MRRRSASHASFIALSFLRKQPLSRGTARDLFLDHWHVDRVIRAAQCILGKVVGDDRDAVVPTVYAAAAAWQRIHPARPVPISRVQCQFVETQRSQVWLRVFEEQGIGLVKVRNQLPGVRPHFTFIEPTSGQLTHMDKYFLPACDTNYVLGKPS